MALYNAGSPPSSPPRVPYWHNESINSGRFERARADASAWADSSNDAIAAQVTQIKELERELQALKLQAESERRFAESQAENSKDARAAKTNAELDRLTVDLEAEGRRSRQLATKVEQARERLYGLKKQASQPAAQMSTGRARTRRLANLAGQLTRTQRKCDEVYAAMKQLKDEARTLETEKSTFEAKLRSLQEEASEHYYEASKAAREYNAANRARDDEVQQTEQLAKQEEAGVKRREAAQKALADAMGAAEKRRALVTSQRWRCSSTRSLSRRTPNRSSFMPSPACTTFRTTPLLPRWQAASRACLPNCTLSMRVPTRIRSSTPRARSTTGASIIRDHGLRSSGRCHGRHLARGGGGCMNCGDTFACRDAVGRS